jgi:hypothetical protein
MQIDVPGVLRWIDRFRLGSDTLGLGETMRVRVGDGNASEIAQRTEDCRVCWQRFREAILPGWSETGNNELE